jgi:elongator complex protein 1
MYKETRRDQKLQIGDIAANLPNGTHLDPQRQSASKVNCICDSVLGVLKSRTATNLQNIITASVCKSPPALEDGLLVVAGLMNESEALAEKAVEHICFLADANKLYDNALGLYNLDLALLVAQQSQKDPREYLPFLQKLQEMAVLRRHFSIDDHLGRHSKALSHLYELSKDDHSELEAYIVKHALYKDALTLYRYQPSQLCSIMSLYASYLESHSQFHEAAIAYEYLRLYGPASTCYQRASPAYWRECIFCASQQSPAPSQEAFASLATVLAESLTEAKDYESAAYIHTTYLSSIPTAVALLCKGYHFASALQLAALHSTSNPELLSAGGPIDTGLTDAHSASTELLAECKAQLLAQVPRIRELRLKAAADPLAFYEGEVNEDIPDDISIAASSRLSTSASLFTRYTGRQSLGTAATGVSRVTSKNRRREERKRARGKKGSVYEEEYLVASVQRLVERIENVRADVGRLVVGLVRRRMREQARAVEGLFGEVLEMCREAVKEIFEEESKLEEQTVAGTGEDGYRPVGGDAVLAESIEAAGKRKAAPHIGAFEKLTLLGA